MISNPKGKCISSNNAVRVCTTSNCTNPPLICETNNCRCQSHHQNCLIQQQFDNVLNQIIKKDSSALNCFKPLLEFCDYGIKQFQIQKDSIYKTIDEGGGFLQKYEKKFIESLRNQSTAELTGNWMAKVIQSLNIRTEVEH